MTQEELKLVLEALKWCHGGEPCGTAEAIAVVEKALAQRTWVGLTDEERKNIMIECESTGDWAWELKAAQAIEAKLKEKNSA